MRRKTSLFAVTAAVILFALVGVGGASATVLCASNASSTCAAPAPSGTNVFAVLNGGAAYLTTSGGSFNPTITCNTSNLTLQTSGAGGAGVSLPGALTALTFSGCTSVNPSGCSTSAAVGSLANATGSTSWTTGVNGTLTLTTPQVSFTCSFFGFPITCSFGGNGSMVTGNVTGGTPATVGFTNIVLPSSGSGGGFTCPTSSSWTASYKSVTASGGVNSKAWYLTNS